MADSSNLSLQVSSRLCFIMWWIKPVIIWAILCLETCNLSWFHRKQLWRGITGNVSCCEMFKFMVVWEKETVKENREGAFILNWCEKKQKQKQKNYYGSAVVCITRSLKSCLPLGFVGCQGYSCEIKYSSFYKSHDNQHVLIFAETKHNAFRPHVHF